MRRNEKKKAKKSKGKDFSKKSSKRSSSKAIASLISGPNYMSLTPSSKVQSFNFLGGTRLRTMAIYAGVTVSPFLLTPGFGSFSHMSILNSEISAASIVGGNYPQEFDNQNPDYIEKKIDMKDIPQLTEEEELYLAQIQEIEAMMPERDELLRMAQESPPPQEWFEADFDPGRRSNSSRRQGH